MGDDHENRPRYYKPVKDKSRRNLNQSIQKRIQLSHQQRDNHEENEVIMAARYL